MDYFRLYAQSQIEEYLEPGPEIESLVRPCANSEFQFLTHDPLEVSISEEGGIEFPDFLLYRKRVPLISDHFRQILDQAGVDNLFYKRIILLDRPTGINAHCWLALAPRIQCLDYGQSVVQEDKSEDVPCLEWQREALEIVIDPERTGNYQIFKLNRELANQDIIITAKLAQILKAAKLENVWISAL